LVLDGADPPEPEKFSLHVVCHDDPDELFR
jgi:hypothetical protein